MSAGGNHLKYAFGPFVLIPRERLLLRDGAPVPITPKAFETLVALVENGGRLMEKNELLERVWPDSFVEESSLTVQVSTLRKLLGGEHDGHKFIETVPKRGYRFVAAVTPAGHAPTPELDTPPSAVAAAAEAAGETTPGAEDPTPEAARARQVVVWSAAAALLVVAFAASLSHFGGRGVEDEISGQLKSITVLPLTKLAGSDDDDFGVGIADAVIMRLSKLRRLEVRPTASVLKYAGGQADPLRAGREQATDAVLTGGIQRSGDRLRVTVRVLRVRDGEQLWAGTFDEHATDLFTIEDSIARQVADALPLALTADERRQLARRYTDSDEARQFYERGRFFWNKRTGDDLLRAIDCFERAVAADPNYAMAYAGLADSYLLLHFYNHASAAEADRHARDAAAHALALDDSIAEAHAALAKYFEQREWDFRAAESHYQRAFALDPNYATGHQWYAEFLTEMGRHEQAVAEAERARSLAPTSLTVNAVVGDIYVGTRQYGRAVEQLRKTLELDPDFGLAHLFLADAYLAEGMFEEAIAEQQVATVLLRWESAGEAKRRAATQSAAYRRGGANGYWRTRLAQATADVRDGGNVDPTVFAALHARLGEKDRAFDWLARAVDERGAVLWLKNDPAYDGLRSDARYRETLRRIGLPD